jgi:tetratricopeptide (TPR) repeat protein
LVVGRENLSDKIHKQFDVHSHIVIHGQGGIGKTTLAKYYEHCHKKDYKITLHMEFYDNIKTTLLNGRKWGAVFRDVPDFDKMNPNEKFSLVSKFFDEFEEKILVIIDINDHKIDRIDCSDLTENDNVKFIFTTRNKKLMPRYFPIKADNLRIEELKSVFTNNYFKDENEVFKSDDEEKLEKIITKIYVYNTKLIVLGAKVCRYSHIKIEEFYEILTKDKTAKELTEKFADNGEFDDELDEKQISEHIFNLFSISSLGDELSEVLSYVSLIEYGGVKLNLFKKWYGFENFNPLNELATRGWVEFGKDDDGDATVLMHPVISDAVFAQSGLDSVKCKKFLNNILDGVNEQNAHKNSHLIRILEFIINRFGDEETKEISDICTWTGCLYSEQGNYSKALEYCNKDLEIQEKVLGKDHPNNATSYNNIGNIYNNIGEYKKAFEYHFKALEIFKKNMG